MFRTNPFLFFLITLFGCATESPPPVSFYYWRTVYQLSALEKQTLQDNNVRQLFIRYFDVALTDGKPVPIFPIQIRDSITLLVIPVVYIRNQVLLDDNVDVETLAENIINLTKQINEKHAIQFKSLQLDCDWSLESKDTYFNLIEEVKRKSRWEVSATIRLHQVKYNYQTGVPPVSEGVLMYYNMARLDNDSSNSIYERSVALQYLSRLDQYPLKLSIALPIFSWGVQMRGQRVVSLLGKTNRADFQHDSNFKQQTPNHYQCVAATLKDGQYFQVDDVVEIESVEIEQLHEMVDDLAGELNGKPASILFYDLDEFNLRRLNSHGTLFQEVARSF